MKFRGRALQKMREPDELDRPVALVGTRQWTGLFVVISAVLGSAIWAFTGSLPYTVSAPGILTSAAGNRAVTTPVAGVVAEAAVQPGQRVRAGDPLLTVTGPTADRRVTAPVDGVVLNLADAVGQSVATGDIVATLEATGSGPALVAQVFVPTSAATSVRPGTDVLIEVEGYTRAVYGQLKGSVRSVGPYPIDPAMAVGTVGSPYVVGELTRNQPTVPVVVALQADRRTRSGFAWTSAEGPPFPVTAQHRVTVSLRIGERTPFDVVLGTS